MSLKPGAIFTKTLLSQPIVARRAHIQELLNRPFYETFPAINSYYFLNVLVTYISFVLS